MSLTRRAMLVHSAAAATVALLPKSLIQAAGIPEQVTTPETIPNRDTTLKFDAKGSVQPFAGNTVICHLPAQCAMRDVISDFRSKLEAAPFKNRLGLTTTDSYHMTIFPGANDKGRKATGWPSYVPLDASIQACNSAVEARMRALRLQCELPFRVAVDVPATLSYPRACTLRMKAIDTAEETKLRSVRNQLATAYGFRLPDHDAYAFHVTLSYQVAAFSDAEKRQFEAMRREYVEQIVKAEPVLELGNPEFCIFPDMLRFEPKLLLRCAG